jgi:hypothetical protein
VAGSRRLLRSGVNLHGTPTRTGPAPLAGEDTELILAEFGLSPDYLVAPAAGEATDRAR